MRWGRGMVLVAVAAAVVVAIVAVRDLPAKVGLATDTQGARVSHFDVHSALLHRTLNQTVITPAGGGSGRPVVLFLHGRSSNPDSYRYDETFTALKRLGSRAPVLVFANGGDHSYYHDRADGRWGSYVTREVLPAALKKTGANPRRVAIGGISMGGFGALDIARLNPGRFCAVGGHSAALWSSGGLTAPGAFDDGDDFARHDVIGTARIRTRPYGSIPIWLDGGNEDPFRSGKQQLAAALRRDGSNVTVHEAPGAHNQTYWRAHIGQYLRFYARALARNTDCAAQ